MFNNGEINIDISYNFVITSEHNKTTMDQLISEHWPGRGMGGFFRVTLAVTRYSGASQNALSTIVGSGRKPTRSVSCRRSRTLRNSF